MGEKMGDFKEITSQEELNRIIGERLERERSKYSDYESLKNDKIGLEKMVDDLKNSLKEANSKLENYNSDVKELEDLRQRVSGYETDRLKLDIGMKNGIPYELVKRLEGSNEEEITTDAKALSKLLKNSQGQLPQPNNEGGLGGLDSQYMTMIKKLGKDE